MQCLTSLALFETLLLAFYVNCHLLCFSLREERPKGDQTSDNVRY